jgi:hypothetical protein
MNSNLKLNYLRARAMHHVFFYIYIIKSKRL